MDYLWAYYFILAFLFPFTWITQYDKESYYSMIISGILSLFIILYLGLRPEYVGTDTGTYLNFFERVEYQNITGIADGKDIGFRILAWIVTNMGLSGRWFLVVCAIVYITPLFFAFRKIFGRKFLIPFFLLICSFFFVNMGTNILRSGIAFSFFMLAIIQKSTVRQLLWSLVASSFHFSIILPICIFLIQKIIRIKPKISVIIWITFLVIAYFSKSMLPGILSVMNIEALSNRIDPYIANVDVFIYKTGFRTDFVIFSLFFIILGLWLRKKVYDDLFYTKLLNTYIICNAFFLLTMEFPYSDRYAVLSWSLIPIVLMYPVVKSQRRYYKTISIFSILGMYFFSIYNLLL